MRTMARTGWLILAAMAFTACGGSSGGSTTSGSGSSGSSATSSGDTGGSGGGAADTFTFDSDETGTVVTNMVAGTPDSSDGFGLSFYPESSSGNGVNIVVTGFKTKPTASGTYTIQSYAAHDSDIPADHMVMQFQYSGGAYSPQGTADVTVSGSSVQIVIQPTAFNFVNVTGTGQTTHITPKTCSANLHF